MNSHDRFLCDWAIYDIEYFSEERKVLQGLLSKLRKDTNHKMDFTRFITNAGKEVRSAKQRLIEVEKRVGEKYVPIPGDVFC